MGEIEAENHFLSFKKRVISRVLGPGRKKVPG
jgi:hypothetical protein